MNKLLLLVSLLALTVTGVGTALYPNNPMFWLASGATYMQYVRIALGFVLFVQLVTNPPRHLYFRIFGGSIAAVVGFWALTQSYSYHMQLLDSLAFMGASLVVLATALERKPQSSPEYQAV